MFLKKIKNILFTILLIISIIPINSFAYSDYIIASGQNIGINIKSKGIMVVGLYNVGDVSPSKDAGIQLGDYITKIDGYVVNDINSMVNRITNSNDKKSNCIHASDRLRFLPVRTTKFLERRFLRREITRRLDDCRFNEIGKV